MRHSRRANRNTWVSTGRAAGPAAYASPGPARRREAPASSVSLRESAPSRTGSVVPELREVRQEGELHGPGRAVPMLCHDDVRRALHGGILGIVTMDEHD